MSRGNPIDKAMDGNNMIVWAMNGEPLPQIHGGPVRLVIAGWPGSVSAKWFTSIVVREKHHDGPGMGGTSYRVAIKPMVPAKSPPRAISATRIDAGALDHHQPGERHQAAGRHQGGAASRRRLGRRLRVRRVDVSVDSARRGGGGNRASEEQVRLAAVDATARLPTDGYYEIWVRATNSGGVMQPHIGGALEPPGLRRQSDQPGRRAGRLSGL